MSMEISRRDMNKNIKWQSTLVVMCTLYQSLAMMILYDGRMTDVFTQEFFRIAQYLYIGLLYPQHFYNILELMIKTLFFQMTKIATIVSILCTVRIASFGIMVFQVGSRRLVARLLRKLWKVLARGV